MCRLLARISSSSEVRPYELLQAPHSLRGQAEYACAPTGYGAHGDGCGIAWVNGDSIQLEKRGREDRWDTSFCSLVDGLNSPAYIAHNRAASKGLNVSREISHPYLSTWRGRPIAFCHNGEISSFISEAASRATTDSQLFMEHFISHIDGLSAREIVSYLQESSKSWRYSSLNAFVLTPDLLCAWRWYDSDSESTFDRGRYYSLYAQETPQRLVISSEAVDIESNWTLVPNKTVLVVKRNEPSLQIERTAS
jgi:predicted glutamine amidotransferase